MFPNLEQVLYQEIQQERKLGMRLNWNWIKERMKVQVQESGESEMNVLECAMIQSGKKKNSVHVSMWKRTCRLPTTLGRRRQCLPFDPTTRFRLSLIHVTSLALHTGIVWMGWRHSQQYTTTTDPSSGYDQELMKKAMLASGSSSELRHVDQVPWWFLEIDMLRKTVLQRLHNITKNQKQLTFTSKDSWPLETDIRVFTRLSRCHNAQVAASVYQRWLSREPRLEDLKIFQQVIRIYFKHDEYGLILGLLQDMMGLVFIRPEHNSWSSFVLKVFIRCLSKLGDIKSIRLLESAFLQHVAVWPDTEVCAAFINAYGRWALHQDVMRVKQKVEESNAKLGLPYYVGLMHYYTRQGNYYAVKQICQDLGQKNGNNPHMVKTLVICMNRTNHVDLIEGMLKDTSLTRMGDYQRRAILAAFVRCFRSSGRGLHPVGYVVQFMKEGLILDGRILGWCFKYLAGDFEWDQELVDLRIPIAVALVRHAQRYKLEYNSMFAVQLKLFIEKCTSFECPDEFQEMVAFSQRLKLPFPLCNMTSIEAKKHADQVKELHTILHSIPKEDREKRLTFGTMNQLLSRAVRLHDFHAALLMAHIIRQATGSISTERLSQVASRWTSKNSTVTETRSLLKLFEEAASIKSLDTWAWASYFHIEFMAHGTSALEKIVDVFLTCGIQKSVLFINHTLLRSANVLTMDQALDFVNCMKSKLDLGPSVETMNLLHKIASAEQDEKLMASFGKAKVAFGVQNLKFKKKEWATIAGLINNDTK